MAAGFENLRKQRTLETMLDDGKVMVVIDARHPEVDVPAHLKEDPGLRLNLSRAFNLELFEIDETGVVAGLSFGGVRHRCVLPWTAIYGLISHVTEDSRLFEEGLPDELRPALAAAEQAMAKRERAEEAQPPDDAPESAGASGEPAPAPTSRPHLRLVKS
jgi:stringent starvation protein B